MCAFFFLSFLYKTPPVNSQGGDCIDEYVITTFRSFLHSENEHFNVPISIHDILLTGSIPRCGPFTLILLFWHFCVQREEERTSTWRQVVQDGASLQNFTRAQVCACVCVTTSQTESLFSSYPTVHSSKRAVGSQAPSTDTRRKATVSRGFVFLACYWLHATLTSRTGSGFHSSVLRNLLGNCVTLFLIAGRTRWLLVTPFNPPVDVLRRFLFLTFADVPHRFF